MNYKNIRIVFFIISFLFCGCVTYNEYKKKLTVSGQIDGHDFVDLGLPSGLKWATYNVGTTNSLGKVDYYSWGELDIKDNYEWCTYKQCNSSKINKYNEPTIFLKYKYDSNEVNNNKQIIIEKVDDVAYIKWGKEWRIPTIEEFKELVESCNWERIDHFHGSKVQGQYGVSKFNGQSIFFPASGFKYMKNKYYYNDIGYYWSSSLKDDANAYVLEIVEDIPHYHRSKPRYCGLAIRAVSNFK